ncbi:hypothetical protein CF68_32255 [Cupriavidus sp. SK-4]|uniref:hypothetical protein n=1 Tax=Cupriavidus sp. SK-4 TaxID=574750 RepID=UPI000452A919|nr:hypothetical protein [Cupriavidus sp. SK-4]EYS90435.1 hypothetical protein CF68_32255 [Cupriavidus sp. SK-4]
MDTNGTGDRTVEVEIKKAEVHFLTPLMARAPILGIAKLGDPTDFRFRVSVQFKVLSQGTVIQTFDYTKERIVPNGDWRTVDTILKSYAMTICELRTDLAETLDHDFLPLLQKSQFVATPAATVDANG